MARIRTIKPEFPQSESMGSVSRESRLLFIMLWTLVDDDGRSRGASRMLASLLYPYDDDAPTLIEQWLDELERASCIHRYEVDGSKYLEIQNWHKHQRIDKPTPSKIPPYSRALAKPREASQTDLDLVSRTMDHGGGGNARASLGLISAEALKTADEVMAIAGLDPTDRLATPPGWCGAAARVETWLAHWTRETILAGVRTAMSRKRDGPPETPRFFEKPIARVHLQLSAPIPKTADVERIYDAASKTPRRRTMLDVADELAAEFAAKRDAAGSG